MITPRIRYILFLMLALAALLRLYALDRADPISDEVLYAFRALGYLDFDFAVAQPSTPQLFSLRDSAIPWWVRLSFHDHPPLVFAVQYLSSLLFGADLWAVRLPSALFGIGSVAVVYLIGRRLHSAAAGFVAAGFMTVSVLMLYASRIAVQESQVLFFILLTAYFFLRARDNPRFYLAWGASMGLALLSKYTAAMLALPFFAYWLLFHRGAFRSGLAYAGAGLGALLASPVVMYNVLLYRTFGHFDFQLFYVFGQNVSYWRDTPGKQIGPLAERMVQLPVNLWAFGSPVLVILAAVAAGVLLGILVMRMQSRAQNESIAFSLLMLAGSCLFALFTGPSPRFLTLVIPWAALALGLAAASFMRLLRPPSLKAAWIVLFLAMTWEGLYGINSTIVYRPFGKDTAHYSRIHWDMHAWGYNELDRALDELLADQYPALTIPYTLGFLEDIKTNAVMRARNARLRKSPILVVYNANMSDLATLWVINRRALYEAWPMISADNYLDALQEQGANFYWNAGFTRMYFIQNTEMVLLNRLARRSDAGQALEAALQEQGASPRIIQNHAGDVAFRLYGIAAPQTDSATNGI